MAEKDTRTVQTVLGTMTYDELSSLMEVLSKRDFLTVNEAVVYFGIGRARLRHLMHASDCDFVVKSGRQSRIVREKLRDYILEGRAGDLGNASED